jgi:hypothetical protein
MTQVSDVAPGPLVLTLPSGASWGYNRRNHFYLCKEVFKIFSRTSEPKNVQIETSQQNVQNHVSENHDPGGKVGHNGEKCSYMCLYGRNIFKIILSSTIDSEMFRFTWKLPGIMKAQAFTILVPGGRVGHIRKSPFFMSLFG